MKTKIFFQQLKSVRKKELDQHGTKITDLCFIKKIYQYWQGLDLILKLQKKY